MRAVVFKGPRTLAVESVPDPVPGDGELVVAPLAVGICGSDVHGYAGETGRRTPGQIMGHEATARVLESSGRFTSGDLITFNPVLGCGACELCEGGQPDLCERRTVIGVNAPYSGALAERMVLPERVAVPLPTGVDAVAGALIEPLAVGIHAARQADVAAGDAVAVLGAGMIGLVCAWAARQAGARTVFATDFDKRKLAAAAELGAVPVHAGAPLSEHVDRELGRPTVDRVIDAVGVNATVDTALAVTRRRGTICLVGLGVPTLELAAFGLTVEERAIRGSFCYAPADFEAATAAIADGRFEARRFVDREIPLDAAPDAFAGLADNTRPSVKTIVRIEDGG